MMPGFLLLQPPFSNRANLKPTFQDHIQIAFDISPIKRTPQPSGATCASVHKKKCYLILRWRLLCFCLCPFCLLSRYWAPWKRLVSASLPSPCRYLYTLMSSLSPSPGCIVPPLTAFPRGRDASVPQSSALYWTWFCMLMSLVLRS